MTESTAGVRGTAVMSNPPQRFELGETFRASQLPPRGTTVVRVAVVHGYGAKFRSPSPCCGRSSLIDAAWWGGTGQLVTCNGCKWKWEVFLALGATRLEQQPRDAAHPHIHADRAEWVSTGHGTRPYHRRK